MFARRPNALLLSVLLLSAACKPTPRYDVILRGGTIYNGFGAAPVAGDVAAWGIPSSL